MDLMSAFDSWLRCKQLFRDLLQNLEGRDSLIAVLMFEGLFRIEDKVLRDQISWYSNSYKKFQQYLQTFKSRSPLTYPSEKQRNRFVNEFSRALTIFGRHWIPIVTNDGNKEESSDSDYIEYKQIVDEMITIIVDALDKIDLTVAVLVLEGFYRVVAAVEKTPGYQVEGGFQASERMRIGIIGPKDQAFFRNILKKWPFAFCKNGRGYCSTLEDVLRNLTVFQTLQVPLFIDNYGANRRLRASAMEPIDITGCTPICHVTHIKESDEIETNKKLEPSDKKNSISGTWFGLDNSDKSVYGSRSFKTTLSKLGVTALEQGEIVCYKNEVNVILYAETSDTVEPLSRSYQGLIKPSETAVKKWKRDGYVKISIFVPGSFLPKSEEEFTSVISGPHPIIHCGFCVRAAREKYSPFECPELTSVG